MNVNYWILFLLILAPVTGWLMMRRKGRAQLRFSSLRDAGTVRKSWRIRFRRLLVVARILCIVLLVVALARPRKGSKIQKISTKGVILELVVDRSGSMEAQMKYENEQMTRLDVVKQVLEDFVRGGRGLEGRPNDLLGLVTFARYADTTCPLVSSHDALLGYLEHTRIPQTREEDGTAIGDAIALAAARLHEAEKDITQRNARLTASSEGEEEEIKPEFEIQSKAIVLLTDGRQNAGQRLPMAAAELAKEWGIKIYTIGISGKENFMTITDAFGSQRVIPIPMGQTLDERLLKAIAERTGGFYGRADDDESLRKIVEKIDEQEQSEIESIEYSHYEERFGPWALAALAALALEMLMSCTLFRKIP